MMEYLGMKRRARNFVEMLTVLKYLKLQIHTILLPKHFNRRNKESWKEKKLNEDENQSRIGTKKFESRNPKGLVKIVPVYS